MATTAFVFPGQGSQRVGMGADLCRRYPEFVEHYYRTADDILGIELSRMCWEGPADVLRRTSATQPAVFLTSLVTLEVLRRQDALPGVVAGHSLGEYAALVCAGVLSWTDALRLVRKRGELMEGVSERVPGTMTAVLGLDVATVRRICAETDAATGQVVEVANDNEPAQIVISGQTDAVREAAERARDAGARRLVPLGVGAPFHCRLMRDIEAEFADFLAGVRLREPRLPVVSSVTAAPLATAEDVRTTLCRQLTAPVRWTETVERITGQGVARFVEVGPGRVLAKLCRVIAPDVPALTTSDADEVSRAVRECASDRLVPSA